MKKSSHGTIYCQTFEASVEFIRCIGFFYSLRKNAGCARVYSGKNLRNITRNLGGPFRACANFFEGFANFFHSDFSLRISDKSWTIQFQQRINCKSYQSDRKDVYQTEQTDEAVIICLCNFYSRKLNMACLSVNTKGWQKREFSNQTDLKMDYVQKCLLTVGFYRISTR